MGNVTILYGIITDSKPFLRYNKQGNTYLKREKVSKKHVSSGWDVISTTVFVFLFH